MRLFALACLLLVLSACKKFNGGDMYGPTKNKLTWTPLRDTIPDHAAFILKLSIDSTDNDETEFIFNHKASLAYSFDKDGSYFPGFGKVSLASVSSDGKDLAIYNLPYSNGLSVGLDLHSKKDGMLNLKISKQVNIPAYIRIWVKDNYANDSLDLKTGVYSFSTTKGYTNSFGRKRLRLVLTGGSGH
jgi:hypothetical protein